jgi:dTDP-4-dehydrorhamnose 3,5-epimerase
MRFVETSVAGAMLIDPAPHADARGRFMRAWCAREFTEHGIAFQPVQANLGFSVRRGTVRGMHFQRQPASEAKLVRCTRGAIFDVVLDLRPNSPSCGAWFGVELSDDDARMLYLPEGCAHGYQTLEPNTEMHYMTSAFYAPRAVAGVRFDDPAFDIAWPLAVSEISEQDRNWPPFRRDSCERARPVLVSAERRHSQS